MSANKINPLDVSFLTNPTYILSGMNGNAVGTPTGTAENTLVTGADIADFFNPPGTVIRINGQCLFSANTNNKTVRVKYGDLTIFTFVNFVVSNILYFDIYLRNIDDDNYAVYGNYTTTNSFNCINVLTASNIPTSTTIKITGQNAVSEANAITCNAFLVEAKSLKT